MKIITNALSARRPDWKRKRDVMVMPPRKPGDPNPVLRASIENTFDDFGWMEPTPSPRVRLEEIRLVGFRSRKPIESGRFLTSCSRPPPGTSVERRRGVHFGSRARLLRRKLQRAAAATAKGRHLSMKSIYGQVAKRHKLSPIRLVGKHYRKYREFAEFWAEDALQTPESTP